MLCYLCARALSRAHLRELMTRKPGAVGMRNAILKNHLKDALLVRCTALLHSDKLDPLFNINRVYLKQAKPVSLCHFYKNLLLHKEEETGKIRKKVRKIDFA